MDTENVHLFNRFGFNQQFSEHKQATTVTHTLVGIFQEKSELHSAYSRGLNRVSVRLREALGSTPGGTVHSAWLRVASALESEARLHQNLATSLIKQLVEPWTKLIDNLTKARKPLKTQVDKASSALMTLHSADLKSKKRLLIGYRTYERAFMQQLTHGSAVQPLNGTDVVDASSSSDVPCNPPDKRRTRLTNAFNSFRSSSVRGEMMTDSMYTRSNSSTLDTKRFDSMQRRSLERFSVGSGDQHHCEGNGVSALITRAKNMCGVALNEQYKSVMSAEEGRVDWHIAMLQSCHEQRNLERKRLDGLLNGLTLYSELLDQVVPVAREAASDIADAIRSADPDSDLEGFRQRSHLIVDDNQIGTATAPIHPCVGQSEQYLLDIPGESQLCLPNSHMAIKSSDRSSILNGGTGANQRHKLTSECSPLQFELQLCLTRECVLTYLARLSQDVEKERRTKQGLLNLVHVYDQEPVFSDASTLEEARRRLFMSRVRLTHMTHCRQKLLYSLLCGLSADSNEQTLPKHIYADALVRAGFHSAPWRASASEQTAGSRSMTGPMNIGNTRRWVPLPDLDDEYSVGLLKKPIEWPPFPSEEVSFEDLNEDHFRLEMEKVEQWDTDRWDILYMVRDTANQQGIEQPKLPASSLPPLSSVPKEVTSPKLILNGVRSHEINNTSTAAGPTKQKFPISASDVSHPVTISNPLTASIPRDLQSPNETISVIPKSESTGKTYSLGVYVPSPMKSFEPKPLVNTSHNSKVFTSNTLQTGTQTCDNTKPLVDCKNQESSSSTCTSSSMLNGSTKHAPRPPTLTLNDVLNAPNSVDGHVEKLSSPVSSGLVAASLPKLNPRGTNSFGTFWTRLGLHKERVDNTSKTCDTAIISPPNGNANPMVSKTTLAHDDSDGSTDCSHKPTQKQGLPSLTNLRCLGWAKVEQPYRARMETELNLLEGDIISIYRKDSPDWWFGELRGTKGLFPVNHVDEF